MTNPLFADFQPTLPGGANPPVAPGAPAAQLPQNPKPPRRCAAATTKKKPAAAKPKPKAPRAKPAAAVSIPSTLTTISLGAMFQIASALKPEDHPIFQKLLDDPAMAHRILSAASKLFPK